MNLITDERLSENRLANDLYTVFLRYSRNGRIPIGDDIDRLLMEILALIGIDSSQLTSKQLR